MKRLSEHPGRLVRYGALTLVLTLAGTTFAGISAIAAVAPTPEPTAMVSEVSPSETAEPVPEPSPTPAAAESSQQAEPAQPEAAPAAEGAASSPTPSPSAAPAQEQKQTEVSGAQSSPSQAKPQQSRASAAGAAPFGGTSAALSAPAYEHVTVESVVNGQTAVAWMQKNITAGGKLILSGEGWLAADQVSGSRIAVKLNKAGYDQYERTGAEILSHPTSGQPDPTLWALIDVAPGGSFTQEIDVPAGIVGGDKLSVTLQTGLFLTGDVNRTVTSDSLVIDGVDYAGDQSGSGNLPASCSATTATYTLAAAAELGGSLRFIGDGWCHPDGTGSVIAVKINDGAFSRLDSTVHANRTTWYIIEVDNTGSFELDIPVPDVTDTLPEFALGSYTFRLLTGSLKAGDRQRTVETSEFTVVAKGTLPKDGVVAPGKPTGTATPLDAGLALKKSTKGGLKASHASNTLTVKVPKASPGDWVYLTLYEGNSPRFVFGSDWFKVNANRSVKVSTKGLEIPTGTLKISAQDRGSALLGWGEVVIREEKGEPKTEKKASATKAVRTVIQMVQPNLMPTTVPAAPVAGLGELTEENAGQLSIAHEGNTATLSFPEELWGQWVYLYSYSEQATTPLAWAVVSTTGTVTVDVSALEPGEYRFAVLDQNAELVGWVPLTVAGAEVAAETEPEQAVVPVVDDQPLAVAAGEESSSALSLDDILLIAAALVVLVTTLAVTTVIRGRRASQPHRAASAVSATIIALLLVVAVGLFSPTSDAFAIPPDGAGPNTPGTSSSVSPRSLAPGETITFSVKGFPGGETLYIKIDDGLECTSSAVHGACVYYQQAIPASGKVSGSFRLPSDISAGSHWLRFLASEVMVDDDGNELGVKGFTLKSPSFTVTTAKSGSGSGSSSGTGSSGSGNSGSGSTGSAESGGSSTIVIEAQPSPSAVSGESDVESSSSNAVPSPSPEVTPDETVAAAEPEAEQTITASAQALPQEADQQIPVVGITALGIAVLGSGVGALLLLRRPSRATE